MPGKTPAAATDGGESDVASMRPQRNAGENTPRSINCYPVIRASMRPQRNAGENLLVRIRAAKPSALQ